MFADFLPLVKGQTTRWLFYRGCSVNIDGVRHQICLTYIRRRNHIAKLREERLELRPIKKIGNIGRRCRRGLG